jgi:hypothetical protein
MSTGKDPLLLEHLWKVVPLATQQRVLQTLSRVVAQHLPTPPMRQEVGHDRD